MEASQIPNPNTSQDFRLVVAFSVFGSEHKNSETPVPISATPGGGEISVPRGIALQTLEAEVEPKSLGKTFSGWYDFRVHSNSAKVMFWDPVETRGSRSQKCQTSARPCYVSSSFFSRSLEVVHDEAK